MLDSPRRCAPKVAIVLAGAALFPSAALAKHPIVFTKLEKPGVPQVWAMQSDGHKRRLLHKPGYNPAISDNGKRVAFETSCGKKGKDHCIFTIRIDGHGLKRAIRFKDGHSVGGDPAWSPNGKRIAFDRYTETFNSDTDEYDTTPSDIYTANPDGTGVKRLTTDLGAHQPAWSPNGLRIAAAVESSVNPYTKEIWTMDTNGGNRYHVTFGSFDQVDPSWSPNGKEIGYLTRPGLGQGQEIYAVKPNGLGTRQVTHDAGISADGVLDFAWSPAGDKVVFAGQLADNAPDFIYREPSNGSGGFHQLKPFGGKDTHNLTDVDW